MNNTVFFLFYYNLKKCRRRHHILFAFLYIILITDMMLKPVRKLSYEFGIRADTFSFPLIWNSTFFLMMFFIGVIICFIDAPFTDNMTPMLLMRCKRTKYMLGHLCYIVFMGIIIPAAFFLIQMILLPSSGWDNWGKLWGTLAQTNIGVEFGCYMHFQYHILWDYSPIESTLVTMLMCILLVIMTGLIMYLFGICHKLNWGIALLAALITLPHVVDWLNFTTFYWLSPFSWICLDTTMKTYNGSLPSLSYAYTMLIIINISLIFLAFLILKRGGKYGYCY